MCVALPIASAISMEPTQLGLTGGIVLEFLVDTDWEH